MSPALRGAFTALAAVALSSGTPSARAATETPKHVAAAIVPEGYVDGAAWLEGRLIAPCCWTQTIDIHGSEIATELRHEIRARLQAGEARDAILDDIVKRYGERILAIPKNSPISGLALGLMALLGMGAIGAGTVLVRWRRRGGEGKKAEVRAAPERDALDDRLDREIEESR